MGWKSRLHTFTYLLLFSRICSYDFCINFGQQSHFLTSCFRCFHNLLITEAIWDFNTSWAEKESKVQETNALKIVKLDFLTIFNKTVCLWTIYLRSLSLTVKLWSLFETILVPCGPLQLYDFPNSLLIWNFMKYKHISR